LGFNVHFNTKLLGQITKYLNTKSSGVIPKIINKGGSKKGKSINRGGKIEMMVFN
jgi:hypothetical protein